MRVGLSIPFFANGLRRGGEKGAGEKALVSGASSSESVDGISADNTQIPRRLGVWSSSRLSVNDILRGSI